MCLSIAHLRGPGLASRSVFWTQPLSEVVSPSHSVHTLRPGREVGSGLQGVGGFETTPTITSRERNGLCLCLCDRGSSRASLQQREPPKGADVGMEAVGAQLVPALCSPLGRACLHHPGRVDAMKMSRRFSRVPTRLWVGRAGEERMNMF